MRQARPSDEDGILDCVRGLAEYEKEPDAVQTTAGDLRRVLFGTAPSFTFEDLFVRESERRHGFDRVLLKALAEVCVQRGYRRFEWSVLDWNEPSIRFYRSIGAVGMDQWKIQQLSGDALTRLATSD